MKSKDFKRYPQNLRKRGLFYWVLPVIHSIPITGGLADPTFRIPNRPTHKVIADNTHSVTRAFDFYNKVVGCSFRNTVIVSPEGEIMATASNHLPVVRDPQDVLTTAIAFKNGGGSLQARTAIRNG